MAHYAVDASLQNPYSFLITNNNRNYTMIFQTIFKKLAMCFAYVVFAVFLALNASYAQNSPLAVKGDQEKFGNMEVVSQYGHVIFADQPDKATVGMLKDHGIKMVISIRGESEDEGYDERKAVEEQGLPFIQIPYMKGRAVDPAAVDELLGLIEMTGNNGTKIMLHCTHSQRAGSLLGAALVKAGHSREEANAIAKDAGMTSEFITRIHNDYLDSLN